MTIKPARATSIMSRIFVVAATILTVSACAQTQNLESGVYTPKPDALALGNVDFASGQTLAFDIGIGSGAFHYAGDPDNVFYAVADRGPNINCHETQKVVGIKDLSLCNGVKAGKVFPMPGYAPTIFKIQLNTDKSVTILETITLKTTVGQPVSGLPNPLTVTNTENAYSKDGRQMAFDANGLDMEAVVRLSDGTYWIADEYAPSLAHVAADGRILMRWIPMGLEHDFKTVGYPVKGKLPSILKWRKLNRGIESVAVSPDEKSLYFVLQSPLAHPDANAYKSSNVVRLFEMDIASGETVGEYIYPMDDPKSFAADNAQKTRKQNHVKVSEMVALGKDRLLVLERISKTTKLYVVDLKSASNIADTKWDAEIVSPSLEQMKVEGMVKKGIAPLTKTLALNTDNRGGMPKKIEGIGVVDANTLMLINDNDFGVKGDKTALVVMKLTQPLF